jgi:cobalt-precorrin-5B (C1)-methyltransferase
MRDETAEQPAPLRSGLTTGSCATATSLAAARLLLTGTIADAVEIVLPKGKQVQMRLEFCRLAGDSAEAGTIKDAGDDPDVTHGALLYSQVRLRASQAFGSMPDAVSARSPARDWCWASANRRSTRCRAK